MSFPDENLYKAHRRGGSGMTNCRYERRSTTNTVANETDHIFISGGAMTPRLDNRAPLPRAAPRHAHGSLISKAILAFPGTSPNGL